MQSHALSDAAPLPRHLFSSLIGAANFDEISNYPGAVRNYIFNNAIRNYKGKTQGFAESSFVFFVYQTGRHGPQNGYRLVVVHKAYHAVREKKEGDAEGEIDKLEKNISQGHDEMVVLGELES